MQYPRAKKGEKVVSYKLSVVSKRSGSKSSGSCSTHTFANIKLTIDNVTEIDNPPINTMFYYKLPHLESFFPHDNKGLPAYTNSNHSSNARYGSDKSFDRLQDAASHEDTVTIRYNKLVTEDEVIMADARRTKHSPPHINSYVRAGPRFDLHYNPREVKAAIVTCGGLCPGLNNVIREITRSLKINYGAECVYGIVGGFGGFKRAPMVLTPKIVENIHHSGGTILGASRGGFDKDLICAWLKRFNVNQLYVIGGDGTHRAASLIAEECVSQGLNVAIAGVPKTIDNDVGIIDRSFGFNSAVEEAVIAIRRAKTEAESQSGIGVVKVMGRSSGFIACHAAFASGDVDLVLIPEVPIILKGPKGCLPHLFSRVKKKGFAVVVLAEGAGEELLGTSTEVDAGGNKKLPQIGSFMKSQIDSYLKAHSPDIDIPVKYIDPSYMIRSVAANSYDSFLCMQLGQNAVHGCMAGFTSFTVGLVNNRMSFLPMSELVKKSPKHIDNKGRTWERIIQLTLQPNTID